MSKPRYTLIFHEPRLRLGLTMNQYAVAAMIYHLSHSPSAPIPNYCIISKTKISEALGISRTQVFQYINELIEKKILVRDPETRFLKTTDTWYNEVESVTSTETELPVRTTSTETELPSTETVPQTSTETVPNTNNTSTNNSTINNVKVNLQYVSFIEKFNELTGRRFRGEAKSQKHFNARLIEGFTEDEILQAANNCRRHPYFKENPEYLTPEFITRSDKLQQYIDYKPKRDYRNGNLTEGFEKHDFVEEWKQDAERAR